MWAECVVKSLLRCVDDVRRKQRTHFCELIKITLQFLFKQQTSKRLLLMFLVSLRILWTTSSQLNTVHENKAGMYTKEITNFLLIHVIKIKPISR